MNTLLGAARAAILALATLTAAPVWATTYVDGEFESYSQNTWGGDPAAGPPASLIGQHFDTFYPSGLLIGDAAGFYMLFTSGSNGDTLDTYLPATGPAGALTTILVDPISTSSGIFGGQVTGLRLNIDFSDAGLLHHLPGAAFGDLVLTGLDNPVAGLDGLTVRDFYGVASAMLAGLFEPYSLTDVSALTMQVNAAFEGGFDTPFAEDHLALPSPPPGVPEPASWALLVLGFGVVGRRLRAARRNNGDGRRLGFNPRRRRTRRMLSAAVAAVSLTVVAGASRAAIMEATYTGIVSSGTDASNWFGAGPQDLAGRAATAVFQYDTTRGDITVDGFGNHLLYGGAQFIGGYTDPALDSWLTIVGVTKDFDGQLGGRVLLSGQEVAHASYTDIGGSTAVLSAGSEIVPPTADFDQPFTLSLSGLTEVVLLSSGDNITIIPTQLTVTRLDVPAGVPDPAAWILMLMGLCAVGAGLRRARGAKTGAAGTRIKVA